MNTIFFVLIRKVLSGILLAALMGSMSLPISPNQASSQSVRARATSPAGLLTAGGALDLATGFQGALNLDGWQVSLDAAHGPLFRPVESHSSKTTTSYSWSPLGTGTNDAAYAIAISGNDVYVGGWFTSAGNCKQGCNYIAKWNGSSWSALGSGTNSFVFAIAVSGNDIYVGGQFTAAGNCTEGCVGIAKWNGSNWSPLGTGMGDNGIVTSIAVSGNNVYAGGTFYSAGNCLFGDFCVNLAKWDGSSWSALGKWYGGQVNTIAVSGNDVYVGGEFDTTGTCSGNDGCNNIAKWNGSLWSPLSTGTGGGYPMVNSIVVSGSNLYVGGWFTSAGTCTSGCNRIAKWNGHTWSALGTGTTGYYGNEGVSTLAVSGNTVYAGGWFNAAGTCTSGCAAIAKWNGSIWSPLGTGMNDIVNAIAISSSGTVYAGGNFYAAGTCMIGDGCNFIAKYNAITTQRIYLPLVIR